MHYKWTGRKPHRRTIPQHQRTHGRTWEICEIQPGQVFEPTEGELKSFADFLEPVGAGLHVTELAADAVGKGFTRLEDDPQAERDVARGRRH